VAALVGVSAAAVVAVLVAVLAFFQARLTQAQADERQARAEKEETERLAGLRAEGQDLLLKGREALTGKQWQTAQVQFSKAWALAGSAPQLAEIRDQANQALEQIKLQAAGEKRYQEFVRWRKDALFHATRFTGKTLEANLKETRAAAEEALKLAGVT